MDKGNTSVHCALFDGQKMVHEFRFPTTVDDPIHDLADELRAVLRTPDGQSFLSSIEAVVIASVVDPLDDPLVAACRLCGLPAVRQVFSTDDFGMTFDYDPLTSLGVDRAINAFAAATLYGPPVVVADFGTATTIDLVSADRRFLGGSILPGIATAANALFDTAGRLQRVGYDQATEPPGKTTAESLQCGIVYGAAYQLDGFVRRYEAMLGAPVKVVATGGLSEVIVGRTECKVIHDRLLTLKGLNLLGQCCGLAC